MHVKKGDAIVVLTGKDKGKKGTIVKSLPKKGKVIVEGLNQVKKHVKPTRNTKGSTISISLPMDVSNVALVSGTKIAKPKTKKVTAPKAKTVKEKKS